MKKRYENMKLKTVAFLMISSLFVASVITSCGAKKSVVGDASLSTTSRANKDKVSKNEKSAALEQLNFVRKVSDNAVYANNIVSKIKFSLNTGKNDISVGGSLHMRKDEVIRIQITPFGIMEAGRLEFTKDYVLLIDRIHKEYVKASYSDVDFLQRNGLDFYALQALFWNQLFVPGVQKMSDSSLKNFSADLSNGPTTDVSIAHGKMSYVWKTDSKTALINSVTAKYSSATDGNTSVKCSYSSFRSVGTKQFPTDISLSMSTNAIKNASKMSLRLQLNTLTTESDWELKTAVSSKYKQVSVHELLNKLSSL